MHAYCKCTTGAARAISGAEETVLPFRGFESSLIRVTKRWLRRGSTDYTARVPCTKDVPPKAQTGEEPRSCTTANFTTNPDVRGGING